MIEWHNLDIVNFEGDICFANLNCCLIDLGAAWVMNRQ